VYGVN